MIKVTITIMCERCPDTKEIIVNTRDINKRFRISDLLKEGTQQVIEGRGICKKCSKKYTELLKGQKKEIDNFFINQEVKNAK